MSKTAYIEIAQLCAHYQVELSYFTELEAYGLVEIETIEQTSCIKEEHLGRVEKVLRMQKDLNLNLDGVDTVMHLLDKIEKLQAELQKAKNRLRLYED